MVRELQPKIVINPRSGLVGDFNTQEVKLRGRENRTVSKKIVSSKYLGTNEKASVKQNAGDVVLSGITGKAGITDVIIKLVTK